MANYDYSVENLLADDSFLAYVYHTDKQSVKYWAERIKNHPEQAAIIAEATLIARTLAMKPMPVSEATLSEELEKLENTLSGSKIILLNPAADKKPPVWKSSWQSIAAAILLLLTTSLTLWFYSRESPEILAVTTKTGTSAMLLLPDSSLVFLSGNSTIRYNKDWQENAPRKVWLEGEAFFHVKPKLVAGGVKFQVHAGQAVVEVVGTRFNVLNRNNQTEVVLTSGKVNLKVNNGLAEKKMALVPGEKALLSNNNLSFRKNKINVQHYPILKEEKIIFEDTSIRKIVLLLREHYGIKVSLQDSAMADLTVSGSFPLNNEKVFLKTLAVVLNLNIEKGTNQEVFFRYK